MAQRRRSGPVTHVVSVAAASLAVVALVGLQARTSPPEMVATVQAPAELDAAPETPLRPSYVVRYAPPAMPASKPLQPTQVSLSVQPASTAEPVVAEPAREKLYVTAGALNVRAGPTSSSPQLAALPFGTKVEVLDSDGNWVEVSAGDVQGWVFAKYLSPTAPR